MKLKVLFSFVILVLFCANSQTTFMSGNQNFEMPNLNQITHKVTMPENSTHQEVGDLDSKRAEEATVQVDLNLDFDPESYRANYVYLINSGRVISNFNLGLDELMNGSNMISIPAGTYDIMVAFYKKRYNIEMHVIRELVVIDQDMKLTFNPNEAKNHIHFQTLTIDGEPVATNKFAYNEENDSYTLLEPGNTDEVYFQKYIIIENTLPYTSTGNFGTSIEGISPGGEQLADFFVNDVSERFAFYNYRVATGFDYDVYTSAYEVQGASGDVSIANDPSRFMLFEDPLMSKKHQGEELYQAFSEQALLDGNGGGYGVVFTPPLQQGETVKYYLGASVEDSRISIKPEITPVICKQIIEQIETPWGEVYQQTYFDQVMTSMPLTVTNGEVVFANNGVNTSPFMSLPRFDIQYNDESDGTYDYKYYPFWPTHPVFTYSIDKKKDILGDNCPLLVTNPMQYSAMNSPFGGVWIDKQFAYNYIGRYGETNLDDVDDTHVKIQVNGEDFYEAAGTITAPLDDMNGTVDATFHLGCTTVDELPATNNTSLHYTTGGDNSNPPTMTMLHFKDSNDDVTDRFDSADEGTIEFSAGDFNLVTTPMGYFAFDRQAPAVVEVSYAPYGTEDWNELPVEELPEYYWPVMGWFYRGSLACVTGQAEKGWFDVKFRLVDEAGNWQEQVVSPAFRIDNLAYSSVATVGSGSAHEVARYSIDGKRVDASHQGVTIIRMSDGTARKILVK